MQPRINGDSLKREHDIAARNCRNRKNKIMAERMQNNCEKMKKYDYTEGVYFVRGIRSHDDLWTKPTSNITAWQRMDQELPTLFIHLRAERSRQTGQELNHHRAFSGRTEHQTKVPCLQPACPEQVAK